MLCAECKPPEEAIVVVLYNGACWAFIKHGRAAALERPYALTAPRFQQLSQRPQS